MELSVEQKIVKHLAKKGYLTNVGDIAKAMRDERYAEKLLLGVTGYINDTNDLDDFISGDCNHKSLSNDEIQEVFDNDNE